MQPKLSAILPLGSLWDSQIVQGSTFENEHCLDFGRQPEMTIKFWRAIPEILTDFALQLKVARNELPWVWLRKISENPNDGGFARTTMPSEPLPITPYQPVSRRPIADRFRKTAQGAVRVCVKLGIHPDVISYLSIVASAWAAICFWKAATAPWLLILGPAFCYLRLWFNMLDGMVALAAGKASWRGEILNDLPDRFSDILIFIGVAHSGLCHVLSGYWAALFAVLTAYVGMFGQAVGVQREFSGMMAKPWRMVTLHIGSWIALCVAWLNSKKEWTFGSPDAWGAVSVSLGLKSALASPIWFGLTVLDWTCLVVVVGCVQTVVVRLWRIFRALKDKEAKK